MFSVPSNATKVEFVSYITGHGWGCDSFNCAEFCNSKHTFSLNGGGVMNLKNHTLMLHHQIYCMSSRAYIKWNSA